MPFQMASRPGQKARTVKQAVRARRVTLPAKAGRLEVTRMAAAEVDAPTGVKPVQWSLLTNRKVTRPDALVELIEWYRAR
ncbi:MAG: hypothetical protein VB137_09705 [Burkholderia sp.]